MYKFIVLAALVAFAAASGLDFGEDGPAAHEGEVRDALAYQQHAVNRQALYHGAGVGTAPYRGVPGTSLERDPAYYAYGHNYGHNYGYGYPYGHAAHGAFNAYRPY